MTIEPVRKEIVVEVSQERAFRVFTDGIDRWWPREHHTGSSPLSRAVLEGRPEGRWYAICEDGSEIDVGRVLAWEPPSRLILAWQITAAWQFDPSFLTEVEVTFTVLGPKRTRVNLEHRNLERYGQAAESMRAPFDSEGGWSMTLASFAKAAEGSEG